MNTRCKVGDSAYVKRAIYPGAIGRVVEVVCWAGIQHGWQVQFVGAIPAGVPKCPEYFIHDENLIPIGGVPVDEEVTEDLKEPA